MTRGVDRERSTTQCSATVVMPIGAATVRCQKRDGHLSPHLAFTLHHRCAWYGTAYTQLPRAWTGGIPRDWEINEEDLAVDPSRSTP